MTSETTIITRQDLIEKLIKIVDISPFWDNTLDNALSALADQICRATREKDIDEYIIVDALYAILAPIHRFGLTNFKKKMMPYYKHYNINTRYNEQQTMFSRHQAFINGATSKKE